MFQCCLDHSDHQIQCIYIRLIDNNDYDPDTNVEIVVKLEILTNDVDVLLDHVQTTITIVDDEGSRMFSVANC